MSLIFIAHMISHSFFLDLWSSNWSFPEVCLAKWLEMKWWNIFMVSGVYTGSCWFLGGLFRYCAITWEAVFVHGQQISCLIQVAAQVIASSIWNQAESNVQFQPWRSWQIDIKKEIVLTVKKARNGWTIDAKGCSNRLVIIFVFSNTPLEQKKNYTIKITKGFRGRNFVCTVGPYWMINT